MRRVKVLGLRQEDGVIVGRVYDTINNNLLIESPLQSLLPIIVEHNYTIENLNAFLLSLSRLLYAIEQIRTKH